VFIGKAGISYAKVRVGRFVFFFCVETHDKFCVVYLIYQINKNTFIMIGWQ